MDLVIFMGHHKVGSSSLQQFLACNWLRLARAGILYPSVESQGMTRNLAGALEGRDAPLDGGLNVREPHNALAFRMLSEASGHQAPPWHPDLPAVRQMMLLIRRQAEALAPRAMVFCSEVMANFAASAPAALSRLREALPEGRRRILCTLRRPDEYLTSWHNQRLKFGHRPAALRDGGAEAYRGGIHFDYRLMLEGWFETFPEAEFDLRDYRDVLASGGSVPDFRARSGLAFPEGLEEPADANPSLPLAAMEIARRGNAALAPEDARALRELLIRRGPELGLVPNREVEMFGAEARARLVEDFAPIHDWLGERTGRTPFFPDMAEAERLRPVPEMEAARDALEKLRGLAAFGHATRARLAAPLTGGAPPEAVRDFVLGLRLD
ncbi:MAG: hypothetical protein ACQEUZ_16090 [Pseudomonadota bacterium]